MSTAAAAAKARDGLAFALIVLFTIVMYAVPGEWIPALEPLRLALVSSAVAVGLMLVRRLSAHGRIQLDGLRGAALFGFGIVVVASLLWSIRRESTQEEAIEVAKSVAIYFAMINLIESPRRLVLLCGAMVLASAVTSIGVIQWDRAGVDLVEGFRARWVGTYADPNRMAMAIGIVVPIAAAFVSRRQTGLLLRILFAGCAGLAVTAMVLSHSRGGFLGLAAAMIVWTLRERKTLQTVLVASLGLAMVLLAPDSFWKRTETVADFREDASAMGRVHAWSVAAAANEDKPWLGTGAGTFQEAWPHYAPPEAVKAYAAHNVFVQVVAELGWVGFLLFLVFVGGGVAGPFEASRNPDVGWLARGIFASLVGYLTCSFSAGFLSSPHFYVLIGLGACADRLARASKWALPVAPDVPLAQPPPLGLPRSAAQ